MRECLRLQPELDECGPDHHRSVTVTEKVSVHFSLLEFFLRQILEIAFILSKGGYLVFDKYFLILIYGWAEEEGVGRREDKDMETIGLDKMYM